MMSLTSTSIYSEDATEQASPSASAASLNELPISFVANSLSNRITQVSAEWGAITDTLSKHDVRESKDGLLWSGSLYADCRGEGFIRRCADNVVSVSILILDYDGTLSIRQVREQLRNYRHAGYTSYSHRSAGKKGRDCFRTYLPLAAPVTPQQLRERSIALKLYFRGADPSSLSISRHFYTPSCNTNLSVLAESWTNDRERLLSIEEFAINPPYQASPSDTHSDLSDSEKAELLSKLASRRVCYEPVWYGVAVALASNGFTEGDFIQLTLSGFMSSKSSQQASAKWRAATRAVQGGHTRSIGYLVNVANGKHTREFQ